MRAVQPFVSVASSKLALNEGERWYLVHTAPKEEARAEFHLKAQGFRIFYPQIMKTIRHARQIRTVRAALFPRYMFVVIDVTRDRWLSIRSTIGVSSLFMCNERPLPIPQGVVEAILARVDPGNITRLDDGLEVGQQVRILSGAFADTIGTLQRLDDNGRVQVLLELMGGEVPIILDRSKLMPTK